MKDVRRVILIVDDDENDRYLLERTFEQLRHEGEVRTVGDGAEGINYLDGKGPYKDRKQYPFPTFIFVDLKMPNVDGFAVLEHIKSNPAWAIVPTLVFTASSDLDDIKQAFQLGACAYHVKPASTEERTKLCRLLLHYWSTSETPQIDDSGRLLKTESRGKLGERFSRQ